MDGYASRRDYAPARGEKSLASGRNRGKFVGKFSSLEKGATTDRIQIPTIPATRQRRPRECPRSTIDERSTRVKASRISSGLRTEITSCQPRACDDATRRSTTSQRRRIAELKLCRERSRQPLARVQYTRRQIAVFLPRHR